MKRYILPLLLFVSFAHAQTYQIGFVTKGATEYWKTVYAGALKAKEELKKEGVDITMTWDAPDNEADVAAQVAMVQSLVKRKVSGIVLAPSHIRTLIPPVENAAAEKIPVVIIDSGLQSTIQASFIATDNYKGGMLAARQLGKSLEGKGNVILFRTLKGASATEARETGFLETIKNQFPGMTVVSSDMYAGGSYESAEKSATEVLKKFGPETAGIFTSNEVGGRGMLKALRAAGMSGKVKFVSFDSSAETVPALKSGEISGLVVQNPAKMGYLGVKTLVAVLKGGAVEREIDTGCVMITQANMSNPAVAELLEPPQASK
jgi:ribose transport system substrate-binding protein